MAKMPENEREMWKRAYTIQEESFGMSMTADGFLALLQELERAIIEFERHPLMIQLAIMVYEYADIRFQQYLEQKQAEVRC